MSKEWCNRVFRLSYPLLKKVDIAIPISEQFHFDNPNYNRYYKKPMIYQNGEIYILCSQWFEYQRECLESWINRPDATEKIKTTMVSNPDDFRFSKDAHIEKSNPLLKGLNERMGTPSHIEYLKMSEDDSRRHKSRCKEYDKK